MTHSLLLLCAALALPLCAAPALAQTEPPALCWNATLIGEHAQQDIVLEVPKTAEDQSRGLMERASLPPNTGMLFVFEETKAWTFWMHNTPMPLDIAALDANGVVLEVLQGVPYSKTLIPFQAISNTIVEMPAGTFQAFGALPPHGQVVVNPDTPCVWPEPEIF